MSYDEFNKSCFEEAKRLYKTANADQRCVLEKLFPELEGSDDEKVREELIIHLKQGAEGYEPAGGGSDYQRWLAWVEKQDVKPIKFNNSDMIDSNLNDYCCKIYNALDKENGGVLSFARLQHLAMDIYGWCNERLQDDQIDFGNKEYWRGYREGKKEMLDKYAEAEKQGEQEKDILEDTILDGYILDDDEDGLIAETIRYKNEKRGGQKYAYKVKPKFNIGDWITNGIDVDKIIGIDLEDENYLFENGRKSDISLVDSNSHLWTIEDAKDGDILAVEPIEENYQYPFVAIFKGRGLDFFSSYCFIGFDGNFYGGGAGHDIENIHPATKEQRNLLFQKMKEAGYEWDAENMELKKIEEKPQLKEGKYYECIKSYHNLGGKYWFDGGKVYFCEKDGYLRSDPNNLIKVYDCENWQSYFRPYTENTACGEDGEIDKEILNAAILFAMNSTDKFACNGVSKDDVIDWLKSFKDRVQSQTKQEWSEGDSIRLQRIIDFLWYNRKGDTDTIYQQEQDIDWLKSLRPQNNWKPSDEQIHCLKQAIDSYTFEPDYLEELYQDLKKLKEE